MRHIVAVFPNSGQDPENSRISLQAVQFHLEQFVLVFANVGAFLRKHPDKFHGSVCHLLVKGKT
jgi:hypothetical protein